MLRRRLAYSVGELAQLSGLSKQRMARLLESNGVRYVWTGNKRLVWLSDIEASFSGLADSMRFGGDNGQ